MLILKKMIWSNWYSYGDKNTIYFNKEQVTQILGFNGSGKSSIALILQEILYNKNSKGIKKQDIANRNTKDNGLYGELYFTKDSDEYKIILNRKFTIKLNLFKNNKDISKHTSTGTYKLIEEIIGLDFKIFLQLTYQSSTDSLQFLTATDSQRKSFLISLFNLDKYLKIYNIFKERYKVVQKTTNTLEGTCNTLYSWIEKHEKIDKNKKELKPVIDSPDTKIKDLSFIENELTNINVINKNINKNNTYKQEKNNISIEDLIPIKKPKNLQEFITKKNITIRDKNNYNKILNELISLNKPICDTCKQEINQEIKEEMITNYSTKINSNKLDLEILDKTIQTLKIEENKYKKHINSTNEFEKLSNLIDLTVADNILDSNELNEKIAKLKNSINDIKKEIKEITAYNIKVEKHNSRIDIIKQQIIEYDEQLTKHLKELDKLEEEVIAVDILRKTFSNSGLLNYKIDFLVKDLEIEINKYLLDFSSGEFQLHFKLNNEKLNIVILNNEHEVTISSLSSGQLARVNISTLLAIRKLMSLISNTKINVLFLDEIMGVLDTFGKDKLIEVLLEEKELNSFLVSHNYTHPLLDKINVIYENNISWLEYD